MIKAKNRSEMEFSHELLVGVGREEVVVVVVQRSSAGGSVCVRRMDDEGALGRWVRVVKGVENEEG